MEPPTRPSRRCGHDWFLSVVDAFLVVDKTSGITSHDVVARVRRATGVKKVGHAGTLDPMATGVVVVAIGRVTRLIRFLQDMEKEYVATACFGVATDSLDADGVEVERTEMRVDFPMVEAAARAFVGEIEQVPPMVSALKKDGKRLYELAREGQVVEREARRVRVDELEITHVGPPPYPEVRFRVVCGKGTYVRSLADDIARSLGGAAHLTALRRTRIGGLGLDRAIGADDLEAWRDHLIAPVDALASLPRLEVDADRAVAIGHGRPVEAGDASGTVAVVDDTGRLLAVAAAHDGTATPEVVVA